MTGALPSLPQRAKVMVRFGTRAKLSASVQLTPAGIVAIGVLVSSILLSTTALVRVARG